MTDNIFKLDGITVINDDSKNIGEYVHVQSVDLVVTSPPYLNQRDYAEYSTLGHYLTVMEEIVQQCYRSLRLNKLICWNIGQDRQFDLPAYSSVMLEQVGFRYIDTICWNKQSEIGMRGAFMEKGLYYPNFSWEPIYVYQKSPREGISIEESFPEMDNKDIPFFTSKFRTNVWNIQPQRNQVLHPAQFPLELAETLIRAYTFTGQTVLEPFGGSGTTAIAARNLGRKCIIFERSEEYFNIIISRLKEPTQMSLL